MRCSACEYQHFKIEKDGEFETVEGNKPFIHIGQIKNKVFRNIDILACPKCKILRIE